MSPAQKSLIVRAASTHNAMVSLAIGDGANDVAMIQSANVGVGLFVCLSMLKNKVIMSLFKAFPGMKDCKQQTVRTFPSRNFAF